MAQIKAWSCYSNWHSEKKAEYHKLHTAAHDIQRNELEYTGQLFETVLQAEQRIQPVWVSFTGWASSLDTANVQREDNMFFSIYLLSRKLGWFYFGVTGIPQNNFVSKYTKYTHFRTHGNCIKMYLKSIFLWKMSVHRQLSVASPRWVLHSPQQNKC